MSFETMTRSDLATSIRVLGARIQMKNGAATAEEKKQWDGMCAEWDRRVADSDISHLIGGGSIEDGPQTDFFRQRALGGAGSILDRAVAGWTRNQMGQPITPTEAQACDSYGISASSSVFSVRFPQSMPMAGSRLLIRNSLSSVDGTSGGYTVAGEFVRELERAMLYSSGILQACEIMRTATGAAMPWPTCDDTDNEGAQIGQSTESTELDPEFGAVVFNAYKLTSKLVRVPHELLRDSAVNIASTLGVMLGERIGRALNRLCTTGNGAATATGIVTAATLGKTAASATAITFDELIDLMHSVDPAYRTADQGCAWMMHDSVAAHIRKLKDGEGNYLWQQSTQLGQPDRLLGWPVVLNNHMDSSLASANKTVLFGALRKYKVRLVAELRLRRLVERYAEFDQEGFLAFQEADGNLLDAGTNPVKYLQQAA